MLLKFLGKIIIIIIIIIIKHFFPAKVGVKVVRISYRFKDWVLIVIFNVFELMNINEVDNGFFFLIFHISKTRSPSEKPS